MDKFEFALQVTVVGFLVVVATLFLLYAILLLFSRIFSTPDIKNLHQPPLDQQKMIAKDEEVSNGPLTAAITAAIYHYMQLEEVVNDNDKVKITVQPSGRSTTMNWRMAGRKELLENREKLEQSRRKKKYENF
ncbi:MAG: OadG family transporter subunit [Bacillota bacterium]|nr:OadG family transporter subunit [Bacillota bacterium]